MKENDIVDLIIRPNMTIEVRIFWFTKSKAWAYVGNPYQGVSESFKVSVGKLKEIDEKICLES
jgi:hypothetical protein